MDNSQTVDPKPEENQRTDKDDADVKENPDETKKEMEKETKKEKKKEKTEESKNKKKDPKKKKKNAGSSARLQSPEMLMEKEDSFDYDEDKIPPDFDMCERHMISRMCAPEREDKDLKEKNTHCKCCGYIIERKILPLNCDHKKLGFLGVGIPLFFSYIQSCFIVLLIIFCISGIFNMASNNYGGDCISQTDLDLIVNQTRIYDNDLADTLQDKTCVLAWVTRISLGNKETNEANLTAQRWLNFVTIAVLMIYFQFMRRNQRKVDKDCDESMTTPGDYTLMVLNVKTGLGIDYDDELKAFFEESAIPGKKTEIVNVNLGYDMKQKIALTRKKESIVDKKQKALAFKNQNGNFPAFYNENAIETQIKQCEVQIDAIEKEFLSGKSDKFCGIAFVTFNTEYDKLQCLKTHYKTFRQRIYNYFLDTFKKFLKKKNKSDFFFYDQRLVVTEAPEPSDVYWENLHYSDFNSLVRRTISESFAFFCLACFGVGIYFLSLYQTNISKTSQSTSTNSSESIKIKIIGTLISICISLVIEILKILIPYCAGFEKKKTRTDYYTSVAVKLAIASFCTSSLITFIITATVFDNYFGGSGLINNQIIVFITNLIIPFLVQLINIPYIMNSIQRTRERAKGKLSTMTQQEANKLFQLPGFVIEKFYAQVAFTMIFTGFYATVLPLGILFGMGTMVLLYWVYKYNLLRKSTVLYDIDSALAYEMTDLLELTAAAFAASEFAFTRLIFKQYPVPSILCLALAGANFLFPTEMINERIFKITIQPEKKTYYEAEDDFDTDYARENPGTGELAREEYERKEDEEQKLQKLVVN